MPAHLRTEIAIQASPEQVWAVLTDFAAFPDWNPFITRIEGEDQPGARLDVRLQPPGGRAMRFRPTVLAAKPGQELRWLGRLGVKGLFDGEHAFRIEPTGPSQVRFVQEERFSGLLTRPILRFAEQGTRHGFEAMNRALKARVEARATASVGQ